jgi:hypothetical protein
MEVAISNTIRMLSENSDFIPRGKQSCFGFEIGSTQFVSLDLRCQFVFGTDLNVKIVNLTVEDHIRIDNDPKRLK